MEEKMRKEFEELYGELFDVMKKIINENNEEYVSFTAMKGKKYGKTKNKDDEEIRFMLIGRAVNGWDEYRENDSRDSFINSSWVNLNNLDGAMTIGGNDRFEWIDTSKNTPCNIYREGIDKTKINGDYKISKSAFWSYTKDIWDNLYGEKTPWQKRWFEKIVWTNLYKIAPHDGGNPKETVAIEQKNTCVKLLKAEMEYFKPTHIMFVTGADWFKDFFNENTEGFINVIFGKPNCCRGENKNEIYVEGIADYVVNEDLTSRVVIACRPESRTKIKYVDAVTKHFKINK